MHYLPNMRYEIAPPVIDEILTGHYHRSEDYYCWRPHGIAAWSIIYTVGGRGRFGSLALETTVDEGQLVLLPPRTPHDYGTAPGERWEFLWGVFDPHPRWSGLLSWMKDEYGLFRLCLPLPLRGLVAERFWAMHRYALYPVSAAAELAMNALEGALLLVSSLTHQEENRAKLDPAMIKAMNYVSQNLDKPLPLRDMALASGQSVSRLCAIFSAI
jgi:AraC family transcriptional regulator of arabinose operon